ncbi:hypothetical protein [Pseudomonas lactis]|uniref:hypothetical protein n=1 Tax=Pseudomonas lactis TaxID=1615674 RepID=UPI003F81A47D
MADDFIRIVYPRYVGGKRKRTSISIDPDLFEVFALARGSIAEARVVLKEWAMEADVQRQNEAHRIGNSRIVQQRICAEILNLVRHGLTVVRGAEIEGPGGKGGKRQAPAKNSVT